MVERTLVEIENNQAALRHCIEESKELVARSDQLIKAHKKQVQDRAQPSAG